MSQGVYHTRGIRRKNGDPGELYRGKCGLLAPICRSDNADRAVVAVNPCVSMSTVEHNAGVINEDPRSSQYQHLWSLRKACSLRWGLEDPGAFR